jgi:hypothetical protein
MNEVHFHKKCSTVPVLSDGYSKELEKESRTGDLAWKISDGKLAIYICGQSNLCVSPAHRNTCSGKPFESREVNLELPRRRCSG